VVALVNPVRARTFATHPGHPVEGDRTRLDQNPKARQSQPPAELEVGMAWSHPLIRATGAGPCLARDQHRRGADEEHLARGVVLSLIDLSFFQGCVRVTEPVRRESDLPQNLWVVPVEDLRPDNSRSLDASCSFNQTRDGLGIQSRVVVQQEQEVGLGGDGERERLSDGPGETMVSFELHHATRTEDLLEDLRRVVPRAVVHRQDAESRMRLSSQRRQRPPYPGGSVAHDDNGKHTGSFHRAGLAY
jgi:hypothetical protein